MDFTSRKKPFIVNIKEPVRGDELADAINRKCRKRSLACLEA